MYLCIQLPIHSTKNTLKMNVYKVKKINDWVCVIKLYQTSSGHHKGNYSLMVEKTDVFQATSKKEYI